MSIPLRRLGSDAQRPITLAVLAMGGQGGGVLVDWIVDLAEHNGYLAQSTSVPGVAQRTGATIYYIELFNQALVQTKQPVLALMPVAGEVDIVIASELMEAGRAMQRGLVTRDRTTLITSSHRDFATLEKVVPGNGIADGAAVLSAAGQHAHRLLFADMQALAKQSGSVISAALFGALAGCGELPFDDAAFEATVQRAGVGVAASLKALRTGAMAVRQARPIDTSTDPMATSPQALPARAASALVEPLRARIEREFPPEAHAMLGAGLARVLEYQDLAYGEDYLNHVADLHALAPQHSITVESARWIAVAMSYEDVIRVADLKTRPQRFVRVREEIGAGVDEVVGTIEYFHPRLEELLGLLPLRLARWIQASPKLNAWLDKRLSKSRRLRPHTLRGQLGLQTLAALRRWRRISLRHSVEMAHMREWLARVKVLLPHDPALAVELLRCRRVVKGYSDTHARGSTRFDRLMRAALLLQGRASAAADLAALREAALADVQGDTLKQRWTLLGLETW